MTALPLSTYADDYRNAALGIGPLAQYDPHELIRELTERLDTAEEIARDSERSWLEMEEELYEERRAAKEAEHRCDLWQAGVILQQHHLKDGATYTADQVKAILDKVRPA